MESATDTAFRSSWPQALTVSERGTLVLDGVDLVDLARQRGTPTWVLSASTITANYDRIIEAFRARYPRVELAYSVKANNAFAVLGHLASRGALFDCGAEYEYELALAGGVQPSRCIVNGNGKSDRALATIAANGARQLVVDSLDEVGRLQDAAASRDTRLDCLVRVQLTYERLLEQDPQYRFMLEVGMGKFGVSVATGQAAAVVDAIVRAPNLDFRGLHHHIGFSGYMGEYSREHELMHHRESARELARFATTLRQSTGVSVERLDLGGGYRAGRPVLLSTPGGGTDAALHPLPTPEEYADAVFGALEAALDTDERPLAQFEMGAHLLADAGVMLTEVVEVKDTAPEPGARYVMTDGTMWMFVNRLSMRVGHPVVRASDPFASPDERWPVVVCGQVCVFDAVAEDLRLPPVVPGDVLAYLHQGAYTDTQSTQFNAFPRPEMLLVQDGDVSIAKRRETLEDLVARNATL